MAVPQRMVPDIDELRRFYVGKNVAEVPKQAVILDRAKMQRHYRSLSSAANALGVDFRGHIKTHKTREGLRLQSGEQGDVKIVISTIAEREHVLSVLQEFQQNGRSVNVLYGIPLPRSQVDRLAQLGRQLGPGTISVMVDNSARLDFAAGFTGKLGFPQASGLPPSGINKEGLVEKLVRLDGEGQVYFIGLYSHSSLSYNDTTASQAMANLEDEIHGCLDALQHSAEPFLPNREITISVGASPQVTSVENLVDSTGSLSEQAERLQKTISNVADRCPFGFQARLELHAGVYSVLDMQQLSTQSRTRLAHCDVDDEIAVSVVAEVCSVYNDGERSQPEALIAAGALALGREPCTFYSGHGVVSRRSYQSVDASSRTPNASLTSG